MSKDKKLNLVDINFKLIENILDKLFDSKQKGSDNTFDNIWNENFVNKFENDVCEKNNNGEYANEIIKTIYENCKSFYECECDNITNYIDDIKKSINKIWNEE